MKRLHEDQMFEVYRLDPQPHIAAHVGFTFAASYKKQQCWPVWIALAWLVIYEGYLRTQSWFITPIIANIQATSFPILAPDS